ncbi:hypothetical protein ACSBR2_030197 [Camellia fascicularis]
MAAFGPSVETICADYFGDEFGVPLPLVPAKKMNNKGAAKAKPEQVQHSTVTDTKKNEDGRRKQVLRFTPAFDGFQPFETLVFE